MNKLEAAQRRLYNGKTLPDRPFEDSATPFIKLDCVWPANAERERILLGRIDALQKLLNQKDEQLDDLRYAPGARTDDFLVWIVSGALMAAIATVYMLVHM